MASSGDFVIYHPGTGTLVAANDAVLIPVNALPDDFDEWEEFLQNNEVPQIEIDALLDDGITTTD